MGSPPSASEASGGEGLGVGGALQSEPGAPPGLVLRTSPPSPPLCGGRVSALAVGDPISASARGLAKRRDCSTKRRSGCAITSAVLAATALAALPSPASADLRLCNRTSYILDLALG